MNIAPPNHLDAKNPLDGGWHAGLIRQQKTHFASIENATTERSRRVEIRTMLPDIEFLRGNTQGMLRSMFKENVRWNDRCLELAFINKHGFSHMDRIATGVFQLGTRLGINRESLLAATLATRFHDVGYDFPRNVKDAAISNMGKEMHARHAPRGAEMFTEAMESLVKHSTAKSELEWWTAKHTTIADHAIRYHSNDSSISDDKMLNDESVDPVSLLPRLIDKLDNTNSRIHESHMDILAAVSRHSVQGIRQRVHGRTRDALLGADRRKRSAMSLDDMRPLLAEVDQKVAHRIAPYAITDQVLTLDAHDYSIALTYAVHPSNVTSKLQIQSYSTEDHAADFQGAYDRSFRNAALVIHALRKRLLGLDDPTAPLLHICLEYEGGETKDISYTASLTD